MKEINKHPQKMVILASITVNTETYTVKTEDGFSESVG